MVVYEALTSSGGSGGAAITTTTNRAAAANRLVRTLALAVWAGPRWLLLLVCDRDRWARGSNESASLLAKHNRPAALSLAAWWFWCCCFCAFAAGRRRGTINNSNDGNQQQPAAARVAAQSMLALGRFCVRRLFSEERTPRDAPNSDNIDIDDNNSNNNDNSGNVDLTITKHRGSCQCGAVQFQIKAPRTLYVQETGSVKDNKDGDYSARIQYPRIAFPVEAFVLRKGRQQLKSFQRSANSPAHTFCGVCGVHLLQAVDPSANELYVNALCLDHDTFVWKSGAAAAVAAVPPRHSLPSAASQKRDLPEDTKATKSQAESQQKQSSSKDRSDGSSPEFSSGSDPEMVELDHDPEFTLTAASTSAFSDHSSIDNDDGARITERSCALSPEKTGGPADGGGTNVASDMFGSFMNVPAPLASDNNVNDNTKQASTDQSNLDASFGSSSTASTTDAQKEQLRKFLGKHVSN